MHRRDLRYHPFPMRHLNGAEVTLADGTAVYHRVLPFPIRWDNAVMRRTNCTAETVKTTGRAAIRAVVLVAAVATAALLLLKTHEAQAHARLVAATPAPGSALGRAPEELRLRFSEPVDARFSRADLVAGDGTAIP